MTDNKIVLTDSTLAEDRVLLQSTTNSTIGSIARSLVADDNIWAEFLKLQISEHTKRTYASALNDFFVQMTGSKRMFGKYKEAPVEKKLPRLVRLDKNLNLDSHQGSHDSSLQHRIDIGTISVTRIAIAAGNKNR